MEKKKLVPMTGQHTGESILLNSQRRHCPTTCLIMESGTTQQVMATQRVTEVQKHSEVHPGCEKASSEETRSALSGEERHDAG